MRRKRLRAQVLVITGATSGNGLATAEEAVRRGAAVVLVARDEAALADIRDRLVDAGGRVAILAADVADEASAERIVETAVRAFGGFDAWINNAGTGAYGTLDQVPVEDHRRIFDVNYFGVLHGSLAAARHLRGRGGGTIVNIGSMLSDRAILQQGPYSATKHAMQALTDTLRMELERENANVSVTLVKLASIDTPFPEHARNFMDAPPRLPPPLYHPSVVADAVLFACTHRRRQLYAGGFGPFGSAMSRLAPRMTDRLMELVGTRMQQMPNDPGNPARRDNLFQPRDDGALRGSQKVAARASSAALELQKLPPAVLGLALAGAGAILLGLATSAGTRRRWR
ncbi:SDR family oxidoreductase [Aureimonas pseudogalii]|uniref:Short-subunit dehydrogenase n=1 Tax=Aureimonas pseudogalii TaxID=1744844 RepID=A0A7W6E9M7_9HYPH|nr:SDR family oxidoreductase [Aureimonas pseudogalii]MBB3997268.1 short-subunit dehydrogenase [Aureimonas pseudogalii]